MSFDRTKESEAISTTSQSSKILWLKIKAQTFKNKVLWLKKNQTVNIWSMWNKQTTKLAS